MDLRTIMNTDAANPPPNSASSPIAEQTPQKRAKKSASYSEYPAQPSQPPPLQQHASPERSSSYASVQSPYQFNAGPTINTAVRSQRSSTPPHVSTPYGTASRDPFGASVYGSHPHPAHPGAPLVSPYTPQPASAGPQHPEQRTYFTPQRSQQRSQSLQSVVTNPQGPPDSFRSPPAASQPLPQFSPSANQSIPGTPLGPPPTFSTRQSPSTIRPPSSGVDAHDSPRNLLSSPRPAQEAQILDHIQAQPPATQNQSSPHRSRPSDPTPHPLTLKQDPLDGVSPHTASRHNSIAAISDPVPSGSIRSSEDRNFVESPTTQKPSTVGSDFSTSPIVPASQMNGSPSTATATARAGAHPLKMEVDHEPQVESQQPRQKRRRYNEPPIFAQRTARTKGRCPIIPNPLPPIPKHARQNQQEAWAGAARRRSSSTMAAPAAARINRPPTIPSPRTSVPPAPVVPVHSAPQTTSAQPIGPLGPWEPSITGVIPYEEITRTLGDFLFQHVVMRTDVNAGDAGAVGQGTVIEVEAKLGHIIDMDSRDRIQLPVLTESVINKENGRFRTSFESKMTVEQHRAMNNFLNETVKASMPQQNPSRIPLDYVHKKERDTFYEIQAAELPPIIRQNLNPRHKPKVRVTTDQRTGEVLAKIVKCRVADLDVCSPRTTVDWRVSVNLEMEYTGDISTLPMIDPAVTKGGRGDRIKDRMSYRHLAYQVDLTQVAKNDQQPGKNEFEHELEVEISAAELRRQGELAIAGDSQNQYEELVKGFVDNIRVLARAVPP